jgi:hypothetical protein
MSNLEDVENKKVPVMINGEKRELLYDLNAFVAIEEQVGKPIETILKMAESGLYPEAINVILWSGLLHYDKNLRLEEIRNITSFSFVDKTAITIN